MKRKPVSSSLSADSPTPNAWAEVAFYIAALTFILMFTIVFVLCDMTPQEAVTWSAALVVSLTILFKTPRLIARACTGMARIARAHFGKTTEPPPDEQGDSLPRIGPAA
uniref:hypothetical protein n=1 Tax=Amycolatopsis sp. CA-293810 TaxID=3239926 RepID=UPI003F493D66